jgi:hypothetical protein
VIRPVNSSQVRLIGRCSGGRTNYQGAIMRISSFSDGWYFSVGTHKIILGRVYFSGGIQ